MRKVVGLVCLLGLLSTGLAEKNDGGDIFAVLLAGSNGYWNYRHQADVAHAYHVLIDHGVKADNIITMMYDDVANDEDNPFPGKLFNQPHGVDVYKGVKIDYTGASVNPDNFLSVLKGQSNKVKGGNGRVLKSTKADKVFIYFADHGDTGIVAIIDDLLTAQDLNETLQAMYDKGAYGELVFYLEACESGSMFEDILPSNVNILAVTASNSTESSWGTYCDDPVLDTCLGDLFSVNWMQDSDKEDLNKETLQSQFDIVKKLTDLSNVMKYGSLELTSEVVGNFQGTKANPRQAHALHRNKRPSKPATSYPSRDIPLRTVEHQLKKATEPVKQQKLAKQLEKMKMKRSYHDMHTRALVHKLMHDKPEALRQSVLNDKPGKVANVACHNDVVKAYHKSCFNLGTNPYAMGVATPLANLCAQGIKTDQIVKTIQSHCAHKNVHMNNIH